MPAMLYACCLPRVAEGNRARIESTNINRLGMKTVYKDLNFKHQNSSERLHGGGQCHRLQSITSRHLNPVLWLWKGKTCSLKLWQTLILRCLGGCKQPSKLKRFKSIGQPRREQPLNQTYVAKMQSIFIPPPPRP